MQSTVPPPDVLVAFNATGTATLLDGGQGETYRVGDIVLKPEIPDPGYRYLAEIQRDISSEHFRMPKPVAAIDGDWNYNGWIAWEFVTGESPQQRYEDQVALCIHFHAALAAFAKPPIFNTVENSWTIADQVAWGEREIEHHPRIAPEVERLRRVLRPVDAPDQLIHGDFGGSNVLFDDPRPPVVIDFSPYWRPAPFALGVMIADDIVWGDADPAIIDLAADVPDFEQYLARGELRRIIELETLLSLYGRDKIDEIDAHRPLVDIICQRCR